MKHHSPHTAEKKRHRYGARKQGKFGRHHVLPQYSDDELKKIVLVGAPNVGKSVVFGALTGKYVDVSNYPGTSVEIVKGKIKIGEEFFLLIDSPGINGLAPHSEDEEVTLNIITDPQVAGIVQVVDAKNFKRGLLLTHQLAELGLPMVVCLNIYDEALDRGIELDTEALKRIFGIEFIPTVATEGRGMNQLRRALNDLHPSHHRVRFHAQVEETIETISARLQSGNLKLRGVALNLINAEGKIPRNIKGNGEDFAPFIHDQVYRLAKKLPCTPGYSVQTTLIRHIDTYTDSFLKQNKIRRLSLKDKIGFLTMHRYYGLPFILLVLIFLYYAVGIFGAGVCVNFFEEKIFGGVSEGEFYGLINPLFIRILSPINVPGIGGFFYDLFVGEYGIITVGLTYSIAIVFPIVSIFFIFFGILEDSGYLPRLTVMSNKMFHKIGLNGRAILPIVLGLGCDTMATFTTRILETRRERLIATLLLALGIPCSAQLGVVLGMMSAISFWLLLVVVITVVSQLVIVGYAASKLLPGKSASLLTEIPPMRVPRLKNIGIKTYFRVKWFMREAVPLFILGTFVLFLLAKLRLLEILEKIFSPIITGLLTLPPEATEAFIVGFLRRDYGAAGLFRLMERGLMDSLQITVGITVMVLFIPCLANFFVIIKERGMKIALVMSVFIVGYAIIVGAVLNLILRIFM